MSNRNLIAAIALAAAGASVSALADDGDVRHAQRLLDEARTYGVAKTTGESAGQSDARREQRREAEARSVNEQRWRAIQKAQSLN